MYDNDLEEFQAEWITPKIYRTSVIPGGYRKHKIKIGIGMLLGAVLFGICIGYMLGLWQQAAQKQNRETMYITGK